MTVHTSDETVPMTVDMSVNPTIGGNMNYAQAVNKPAINGHELAAGANSLSSIGVYSIEDVDDLLDDKADVTDLAAHEADTAIHVTAAEKAAWNAKADTSDIPEKVSDLTNDAGYITGYTETDPTVPAWAKQSSKPTYTAAEVGALPDTTSIPSKTSDLTNDSGFVTDNDVPNKLSDLTDDIGVGTHIADTTRHITAAERQSWNGKQDAIADLATIRSGAALGATAVQTETDPTVPSWAKAASKPSYSAAEVGAIPAPASPSSGQFLVYNGSAWVAQSLSTWQGGNY